MPRPKGMKNSKRFEKSVKAIVQEELKDELEEKYAITDYGAINIKSEIPSGVVLNGQGNFFQILPEITQSTTTTSAYNQRVGNEINLKEIDIQGYLSYNGAYQDQLNFENAKLAVRVMILRAKEISDGEVLFNNMLTNTLLRFGGQTSGGGTTSFDGFPLSSFRDINRDTFAVRYDKVHYLNAPVVLPGSASTGGVDIGVVPSSNKIMRHKLKFGKGLKLCFSNAGDTQPNNFPYFMVIGYSSMSGATDPTDNLVRCSFSCVGTYTDA